jgi:hypothetical protein
MRSCAPLYRIYEHNNFVQHMNAPSIFLFDPTVLILVISFPLDPVRHRGLVLCVIGRVRSPYALLTGPKTERLCLMMCSISYSPSPSPSLFSSDPTKSSVLLTNAPRRFLAAFTPRVINIVVGLVSRLCPWHVQREGRECSNESTSRVR